MFKPSAARYCGGGSGVVLEVRSSAYQGSRRATHLLRLPRRALETSAHDQRHRKFIRDRASSHGPRAIGHLSNFLYFRRRFNDRRVARFCVEGDDVRLHPKAALSLAMLLHELATNAAIRTAKGGYEFPPSDFDCHLPDPQRGHAPTQWW
jgi:hypothetical protein